MMESVLEREAESGKIENEAGISAAMQILWLGIFVLVLYELLEPHLRFVVPAP